MYRFRTIDLDAIRKENTRKGVIAFESKDILDKIVTAFSPCDSQMQSDVCLHIEARPLDYLEQGSIMAIVLVCLVGLIYFAFKMRRVIIPAIHVQEYLAIKLIRVLKAYNSYNSVIDSTV